MKTAQTINRAEGYAAPSIEVIEIATEQGFAQTYTGGPVDEY